MNLDDSENHSFVKLAFDSLIFSPSARDSRWILISGVSSRRSLQSDIFMEDIRTNSWIYTRTSSWTRICQAFCSNLLACLKLVDGYRGRLTRDSSETSTRRSGAWNRENSRILSIELLLHDGEARLSLWESGQTTCRYWSSPAICVLWSKQSWLWNTRLSQIRAIQKSSNSILFDICKQPRPKVSTVYFDIFNSFYFIVIFGNVIYSSVVRVLYEVIICLFEYVLETFINFTTWLPIYNILRYSVNLYLLAGCFESIWFLDMNPQEF